METRRHRPIPRLRAAALLGPLAIATATSLGVARPARAEDPLNSNDKTTKESAPKAGPQGKNDFNVFPVIGGDTDIGFGGGAFANLARLQQGVDPYLWNVEAAGSIMFKPGSGEGLAPYQDVWLRVTVPRWLGTKSRLVVRPSYTYEGTLGYYGLGNAAPPPPPNAATTDHEYGRRHPSLDVTLTSPIVDHVAWKIGVRGTANWLSVSQDSLLSRDHAAGSAEVRRLLGDFAPHGVVLFSYGLAWDNRDSEVSPHSGMFHEVDFKISPGGADPFPYRYGQATAIARFFVPVVKDRVTFAVRGVADVLFGDVPFYELARFDDTYALGGSNGVRGVPAQRYSGKVKTFGNVEVRTDIVHFHLFSKNLLLGSAAFFDAGRVWTELGRASALDGDGIGLKYGVGAGLRLQSGETFLLRGDVAWSPDATPIGGYFNVGQTF